MNRQSIHQQIESLLKTIHDQHDQIKQHKGSIPQVEIDFMIQNLRQLFEASLLLNHTNALSSLDEVKAAVTQKILAEKRAIELKKPEEKVELKKEEPIAEVENTEIVAETSRVNTEQINIPTQTVNASAEMPAKVRKGSNLNSTLFEDKPTLGDKFGNEERLHVKIASKTTGKTLADKLHKKPIKDLKAAIGINEKFLFINRLFEGNLQNYSTAIEKIDAFGDYDSAKTFVTAELAVSLNWDESNEHVKSFMELVERRFIS